jgi:hypothetical protein
MSGEAREAECEDADAPSWDESAAGTDEETAGRANGVEVERGEPRGSGMAEEEGEEE